jgi:hypothetical protein
VHSARLAQAGDVMAIGGKTWQHAPRWSMAGAVNG